MNRPEPLGANGNQGELELVPVQSLKPAPENDDIYRAIAWNDPAVHELARSIAEHGIQEPILISRDGYIISGHRRRMAAFLAELELVPVRFHPISRAENHEAFKKLLVEMNTQRVKSTSVLLHESLVKIDPESAHQNIVAQREEKDFERRCNYLSSIDPDNDGARCEITQAKQPFLDAIHRVLDEQRQYWPLSDRQIHYRLLGPAAPLMHASKPASQYGNNKGSYRSLTDLLTRGRINSLIPWEAIEDVTRPVNLHNAFWNPAQFFRQEFTNFLSGYWRNLQQSQPDHIEIVAEKLTVQTILKSVAREHTIPLTISRGMSSLPPKKAIYNRYLASGKKRLVLLVVSDLDPAGDAIAEDLVKSFRRDFGISQIDPYKVALTIEQVNAFNLAPSMDAKESSPTYSTFVARYGITQAFELEAMNPADLATTLTNAIDDVLDIDLFNEEVAAEKADSAKILAVQTRTKQFFESLNLDISTEG